MVENPDSEVNWNTVQEYEMVCPLFAQHASEAVPGDTYQFKYEEIQRASVSIENT